jgi:hypothetical protein
MLKAKICEVEAKDAHEERPIASKSEELDNELTL